MAVEEPSPHFSPRAVMIAEDFGPARVLATESIAGTTVEGARARTGTREGLLRERPARVNFLKPMIYQTRRLIDEVLPEVAALN